MKKDTRSNDLVTSVIVMLIGMPLATFFLYLVMELLKLVFSYFN